MEIRIINRKVVAILLMLLFLGVPVWPEEGKSKQGQTPLSDEAVVHLGTKLVTFFVTVTDGYGRLVTGLDKDHFEIFDDKVKQNIEFFSAEDAPVSITLVFDRSGSMKNRINRSLALLRRFIDANNEKDEFSLVTFNSTAKLNSDFTHNADELANSLMMTEAKGSTALYDAVYIGIEKARHGHHAKKAVLILSDGQDNNSRYSLGELKKLSKEADVMIYAIGIIDPWSSDQLDLEGRWILEDLAGITGGKAFFPTNDTETQDAVVQIALELRRQYSIGFSPTNTGDGRWHKIKIKLNPPKGLGHLSVRGREGYFSKQ